MKLCRKCVIEKEKKDFSISSRNKDGLQSYCKVCAVETRMKSYSENINKESEYRKNKRKQNQRFIQDHKESKPCMDCGVKYPYYVMDFDHIDNKDYNVSQMLTLSSNTILKEIEKCNLVCSNCHRIRTYKRMINSVG